MSLLKKIQAIFAEEATETEMNFIDVKTVDNRIMRVADLAVGQPVMEITEEGEMEVEDGDYELEDGTVLKVEGGLIAEIVPAAEEDNAEDGEEPEVVTEEMESTEKFYDVFLKDGGPAHVINTKENEMNVGDKMLIEGIEAAAGEYELSSGETLTVSENGVIDSIVTADETVETPEAEVTEEVVDAAEQEVQGVINNLKNLVNQIKELKSQFEEVKTNIENLEKENTELKGEVAKFAGAPSAEPTKTKVDFTKAEKEDRLKFFGKK
jgi:hypothetical protein